MQSSKVAVLPGSWPWLRGKHLVPRGKARGFSVDDDFEARRDSARRHRAAGSAPASAPRSGTRHQQLGPLGGPGGIKVLQHGAERSSRHLALRLRQCGGDDLPALGELQAWFPGRLRVSSRIRRASWRNDRSRLRSCTATTLPDRGESGRPSGRCHKTPSGVSRHRPSSIRYLTTARSLSCPSRNRSAHTSNSSPTIRLTG